MGTVFRIEHPDGRIEYSDRPLPRGPVQAPDDESSRMSTREVQALILALRRKAVKFDDYINYFDYLRHNQRFWRWDQMLRELQREDPIVWMKLQKYPQFRPLLNSSLGVKAADQHIAAGVALARGKYTGSVEKWLTGTVKEMMKRDRWGPFAPVLGAQASTLPSSPPPHQSNSRLGRYLEKELPRAQQEAKAAAKAMDSARAAVRTSKAAAVTRGLSPLVDLGIGALDPDFFKGISYFRGLAISKKLVAANILTYEEGYKLPKMLARGQFDEVVDMIESGLQRREDGFQ